MKLSVVFIAMALSLRSFSQDKPAYKIFTGEGKKADYGDMIKDALKSRCGILRRAT